MRRRMIITIVLLVVVVGVAVFAVISSRAPALSSVGVSNQPCAAQTCLHFPTITGDTLTGASMTLPADFKGRSNLVIVPFDENQQVSAQTWLPFARDLAAAQPDFAYYNVPVFPNMAAPMRTLIRSGMSLTISDAQLRAITITVFLDDRDPFLSALNIASVSAMPVFLLDSTGQVLWRGSGVFTSEQGNALKALVVG